ncbi:tyrosine-type recombinase/integrase [Crocinitomix algicola]|uniref:tyrosine-type recombinase/integrase n=1 Tax=Crocinitomix algicola TaxID=1740263 RepID=UPI0008730D28|nr:tyrosine-type recombinase/integrase [Crocinitomix algicola]
MQFIQEFENYLIHERRYSPHTVQAYRKDLEQYLHLTASESDQDVKNATHKTIRNYIVDLVESGLENSSINRKLSSVKTFFKFLRQQNYIDINPAIKARSLKQKKVLPQFVPESQLWSSNVFEDEKDPFYRAQIELILELFYQTGIRLSELINLKEVDINSKQIKVLGKRNKERIVPISKSLYHLIVNYQKIKENIEENSPFLMIHKNGKKLGPKFVYSKVNYYLGKATNLSKKSPHVLRHTFATHMLNNGASLESIKKLLGHTDLSSTQIYTHNSFKQIKTIYEQSHPRGVSR